jgi:Peptidase M50B-like
MFTLNCVSTTQTPLPGPEAALIGLVVLVVVIAQVLWPLAEHFNVMAHEGMHAITAAIVGFTVLGIELNSSAEGETRYPPNAVGPRRVVTSFVGYLGPSAFGLGAAKLITLGYIIAVLWVAVIFLVLLLLNLAFPSFGCLSVPVAIAVLYLLIRYASVGLEVVMTYGMTWLLLLSGVRVALQDGASAGDASNLSRRTHLPRILWALLWLAGTFGAVFISVRLLVLRA